MSTDDDRTMLTSESARDPAAAPRADWPAQPPTTLPPGRKAGQRSSANLQWALLAIGAAVLIVLVAVAGFGLGFFLGRNRPAQRVATNAPAQADQGSTGQLPGAQGQAGQRLQQYLQNNGASLLRGTVSAVDTGSLTVDTPQGKQTVALTQSTTFLGPGAAGAGGAGGVGSLHAGASVWVVTQKGADGKPQALAVRVGQANAAQQLQQQ